MTQQTPSASRGWIVTLAALGINLASGTLYAWSVIGKALATRKDNPWTKMQAASPFAMATATFAVTMIFAGRLQDKLGPRWIAMLGGVLLGSGFIAASFAATWVPMTLAFALVGVGIGFSYAATTPAAVKWFHASKRGLITGLVVAGVGLAAVYASPLAQFLLGQKELAASMGISTTSCTLLLIGIGTIVVISLLAQIVKNPPAGYVAPLPPAAASASAKAKAALSGNVLDYNEMLLTPQFYLLWLTFVLAASAGLMIISNVATIAKLQAGWDAGFWAVMLLAIFNTVGRVVSGYVSDRIGRTNTMILAFVIQAANMFAFSYYTNWEMIIGGSALAGICYGTIFTLFPAATADFYGVKNLGVNYGLVFTAFGVAGSLGSLLGGRVADLLGSYSVAYIIAAVMLLAGAVLAFFTRAPKASKAEQAPAKA